MYIYIHIHTHLYIERERLFYRKAPTSSSRRCRFPPAIAGLGVGEMRATIAPWYNILKYNKIQV